jgi:hypothetical protein
VLLIDLRFCVFNFKHREITMEWTPGITSKLASSGTMHIESERLKTFDHRWPFNSSANLSPSEMAAAGLFFDPHPKTPDRAICFACKNALSNWDVNDHPMEEHKRWYKTCAFVTGVSKNVPILIADRLKSNASASSPATLLPILPAVTNKAASTVPAPAYEAPKPPPLNSYLQSLGAPLLVSSTTGESSADQISTASASEAEIVYSLSAAPSSKLLDDSFWSVSSVSSASCGANNSTAASMISKSAPLQTTALKPAVISKPNNFEDQEDGLVVQHNSRRLKKKPSVRTIVIESSNADCSEDPAAATAMRKLHIENGHRSDHVDSPAKVVVQNRIFNLASAFSETASARAELNALRTHVENSLGIIQQQLCTFPLEQLDRSVLQPMMKNLTRLERATANIRTVQLSFSSRHAIQLEALKDITVQVELQKSHLNVRLHSTSVI